MRRLIPLAVAFLASGLVSAQSIDSYFALRRKSGITHTVSLEELANFSGVHTIEFRGVVKGTFATNGVTSLMVERSDKESQLVEATTVPDWISGNEVAVRLLVKASKPGPNDPLKMTLLMAAPEAAVSTVEQKAMLAEKATVSKPMASRKGSGRRTTYGSSLNRSAVPREWSLPASDATPVYARFIKNHNRKLSYAQANYIATCVIGFGLRYRVDPILVMAVLIAESDFDPGSTSHTGAMGLGQLMPGTARDLGVSDPYNMLQNIYGCVKLLSSHINKYKRLTGDDVSALQLAIAAYNAGTGAVARAGGIPRYRETQAYVRKVVNLYVQLSGRR